ncbi:hypothetical protein CI102_14763 [Trichoderma harzianum]|uniref:Cupin 2 conserved barrel domain-containing protein n=1 Tax=Trichoderma harzianum CBS 226.95 TaxID=983964 RepID=A0A2T3ZRW1_TRIHA|nr:hypothetical protein M431DRAFT_396534 [Trichoderma harzianum CBS 226.95]PKK41650.1 hypothetical protein CI102_14763 [Trichoderma harzianum]PTB47544.1 hypothetical protein M431DRAFT_396534 [Trichoderma harzianum CBS 226.95]
MSATDSSDAYPLPIPRRIISTHDTETGHAVFCTAFDETSPWSPFPNPSTGVPVRNIQLYSTSTFPVRGLSPQSAITSEADADADLKSYRKDLEAPVPPEVHSQATMCRIVDFPPRSVSDMHRTLTLDYVVILDGSVEWSLDSGNSKVMRKGDVLVQRGTAHSWKNITPEQENGGWLRMFFVVLPIEKVVVKDGQALGPGLVVSSNN